MADEQISPAKALSATTCELTWRGVPVEAVVDQWLVQLTREAVGSAGSVSGAAGLFESSLLDMQIVRGLGIEGMLLLQTQPSTEVTTIENWLADNSAVDYFEPNMVLRSRGRQSMAR